MLMIVPISGGPAAPGVIMTDAPMVTGDPGIDFLLRARTRSDP
jgi:hypothetical protein